MRVAFLSAANSVHAIRWVNGLVGRGLDVHLLSAHDAGAGVDPRVQMHRLSRSAPWAYLLSSGELAASLETIAPDLLNAHYATGYGLLARLTGFRPTLLSVWGSDVYDFPRISPAHRWMLRGNLRAAAAIASTSDCMARRVCALGVPVRPFVTPFGVDEQIFVPGRLNAVPGEIVIGTVKTLARTYGVDVLIEAFAMTVQRIGPATRLRLEITGAGPEQSALEALVGRLGLSATVTFHGAVPHARVPEMLHRMDIFVALSREESFGVAAIEAAACEKPVVVSDAEGLAEVTRHEETGLIVPRDHAAAAADALTRLVRDEALRIRLGRAGRARVLQHYTWDRSLDRMIEVYRAVLAGPSPCAD
ncbi:MAG: glycosyltransferase [Pseudomonadota bacterium]|nr:glycosyltransferase [Pseudomonadota bacterium]